MLYDHRFPGRTRFIAHSVREIRNRLPDVIAGTQSSRMDYVNLLDNLVTLWRRHGFNLDGTQHQSVGSGQQLPTSSVSIPLPLYRKISTLLRDHSEKREKSIDKAARLFEAITPENQGLRSSLRPIILQWFEVTNWFMEKAHDSGVQDSETDEEELRRRFELFELALGALVRGFFKTIEGLDEILEDANS